MSFRRDIILICYLALLALINSDLNPFTATDLHKLKRMSSPTVSQDGKYVVYSVRKWNNDGKVNSYLEYIRLSDNQTFPLTDPNSSFSDSSPLFSKNFPGVLAFLSNRSGSSQLHLLTFPSEEGKFETPTQFTNFEVDIDNVRWNANTFTFTAQVFTICSDLKCTADKNKEVEERGSNSYHVYTKLLVRHWDKYDEGKVSHLFFFKVKKSDDPLNLLPIKSSNAIETLKGIEINTPVPPDGDVSQYDLSSDGLNVAFTAQGKDVEASYKTDWKIILLSLEDVTTINVLTYDEHKGRTQNPRFSPNGKTLSYLYMNREGLESDSLLLKMYDLESKKFKNITSDFDRSVMEYSWVNDDFILFSAVELGTEKTFGVQVGLDKQPVIQTLLDDGISSGAPISYAVDSTTTKVFFVRNSFVLPQDLWNGDFSNGSLKNVQQLTFVNKEALANFNLINPEIFFYTGGYGDKVQGWVFKPINFDSKKKYPLAFLIHGGPESPFLQSWSYRWNPQIWTSRGYAVLMINPHGSPGQGQKFTDAVINDWGGVPYKDLMDGLDYVSQNYSWIDGNNACALGASYGGFMVNWIQGQTDRFKCLVTHDGVFSTVSMFYATEELWFPMAEYCPQDARGCKPWETKYRENYTKFSPEMYVANWKTPHLVIHGSRDYRIPISEGLSVFTALQLKNIPSKFLHFSEENHWVLRAENSIKWYDEVIGWLDSYTSKKKN